ncbi:unnamed protein product [Angiostrongylus costaricensis]|uniref:Uncharacterized protein n=1 Tax=Angiostrongylus costaricensis TaxID=334426 RepID=A0A0R3PES6_ANGCS|nr:unnamed protein product [Angiostrongylus costaricensis]
MFRRSLSNHQSLVEKQGRAFTCADNEVWQATDGVDSEKDEVGFSSFQIENWIDAEVAKLFNGNEDNGVDIDLDTLLGLDTVPAKRKFVFDHLQRSHCPASMDKITMFLDEMIDQLKTL